MGKRIEFDEAARQALRRGVDQLAGAVRVTLGPSGRNVVIEHAGSVPAITNDGSTIAQEVELADRFENMGAMLVREVSQKTAEVAGDGTTTATVLAHAIVSEGLRAIAAGHNPVALKRGIDRATQAAVEALREQSRPIGTREEMARVATISAGDDRAAGELVAEALERVGAQGVVSVEEGRAMETTLEVVEGVRFDQGYLSPYFISDPESMEAALDRPLILLTDLKLASARDLMQPLEHAAEARRPLLVIADDVEGEALALLVVNRLRGTVASCAVRAPFVGERRDQMIGDLAALTGATPLSAMLGRSLERFDPADLGRAQRAVVNHDSTTLIEGAGDATRLRERIESLRGEIAEASRESEREWLRTRLGKLSGGVAVIHVGAPTELALRERRARLEDALAATQAAIEEGVVPGGGVALLRCRAAVEALELGGDERVGRDLVLGALAAPARQIAHNAGEDGPVVVRRILDGRGGFGWDARTGRYGDLLAAGIVDPAKVTRVALQNAASIGGLVLTTDAVVVEDEESEEPPPE